MSDDHINWAKSQFDMIVLTFLVCFGVFCLFRAYHFNLEPSAVEFIKTLTSGFSGALLLRINTRTGLRKADGGSNGKQSGNTPNQG